MTEFTAGFLATQGGIVAAVIVVTGVVKWLLKLKGDTTVIRAIALATAIVASILVLTDFSVNSVFVAALNGCLCALVAMKGYELGSPVVSKLWNAE